MKNINYILGIIFCYTYTFISIFLTIFLLYTDNVYYIIFMLFIIFCVLLNWYIFNDCIAISLENYLLNKKNEYNDLTKYKTIYLFNRKYIIFDYTLYSSFTYVGTIVFIIAIIKLIFYVNKLKNKSNKY